MERLTDLRMKGDGFISLGQKEYKSFLKKEKPTSKQIYQRLLEIEDILGEEYDLKEIHELLRAKADGRLMILNCKIGDVVYFLHRIFKNGRTTMVISEWTITELRENKFNPTWYIAERQDGFSTSFSSSEIGKTIFFTHEEAEVRLREIEGNE